MRYEARSQLLKGIAHRQLWLDKLINDRDRDIGDIAAQHSLSEKCVRSTLTLALLSPDIVEAAVDGKLPRGITVTQMTELPANWKEQRRDWVAAES